MIPEEVLHEAMFKSCDCGACKAKKEGKPYKGPKRGTCLELKDATQRQWDRWEEEKTER